jgi:hypothetical protein
MADTDSTTNSKILSEKTDKSKLTSEELIQLKDKILEIQQINCEERLVSEQLKQLNAEKQYLQDLLNILYTMDQNERMKNTRSRQRLSQKKDSS